MHPEYEYYLKLLHPPSDFGGDEFLAMMDSGYQCGHCLGRSPVCLARARSVPNKADKVYILDQ